MLQVGLPAYPDLIAKDINSLLWEKSYKEAKDTIHKTAEKVAGAIGTATQSIKNKISKPSEGR